MSLELATRVLLILVAFYFDHWTSFLYLVERIRGILV